MALQDLAGCLAAALVLSVFPARASVPARACAAPGNSAAGSAPPSGPASLNEFGMPPAVHRRPRNGQLWFTGALGFTGALAAMSRLGSRDRVDMRLSP
jgi:hypothetical protein